MKRIRFWFETAAFRTLIVVARFLPRSVILACGSAAGRLGYLLDGRHRRIALDNLQRCLGETLGDAGARRVARACWRHFGRITLDTLCFPRFGPDSIERIVRYEGLDHIRRAYAKGRGVLLFSAHFGHWELTALMQGYLDLPLALVTRPLDNGRLERLLAELRGLSGNRVIHKRNAVREIMRALREPRGVAIVLDQDARRGGIFVPFFGRPASTTPTLALVALRSGAAVVPTYSIPEDDGTYTIVYEPEIEVRSTHDRDADVERITAECTARIERWVRDRPDLWLWMHRRWKTRPPSAAARDEGA